MKKVIFQVILKTGKEVKAQDNLCAMVDSLSLPRSCLYTRHVIFLANLLLAFFIVVHSPRAINIIADIC